MAYNYPMNSNFCYGNCQQCNNNGASCCYQPHCYHCSQNQCMYTTAQGPKEKKWEKIQALNRYKQSRKAQKNKLTKSQSTSTLDFDCCGDNKNRGNTEIANILFASQGRGGYDYNCNGNKSSSFCCNSSSRKTHYLDAEECCCCQSQSRNFAAQTCDINRLMAMVNEPLRICYPMDSCTIQRSTVDITCTADDFDDLQDSEETLQELCKKRRPLPTPINSRIPSNDSFVQECCHCDRKYKVRSRGSYVVSAPEGASRRYINNVGTKVKFTPPDSCFMFVKSADRYSRSPLKVDREVQCAIDISSDFCTCYKSNCEFCAKKIICTCTRIRCCMCGKLKSTADRLVHYLNICHCPKSFRSCDIGDSYLRFNSSPVLNKTYSCDNPE